MMNPPTEYDRGSLDVEREERGICIGSDGVAHLWLPMSDRDQRDAALLDAVAHALRRTGYSPLRDVQVECERGRVVLSGRVPSYHLKQMAQTVALEIAGVLRLQNDIDVGNAR